MSARRGERDGTSRSLNWALEHFADAEQSLRHEGLILRSEHFKLRWVYC